MSAQLQQLQGWVKLLKAAAPANPNAPTQKWICLTNGQDGRGHIYQVLTPEQVKNYYKGSSWGDYFFKLSCKKLSLDEIAMESGRFLNNFTASHDDVLSEINRLVDREDINGVDAEKNIKEALNKLRPNETIQSITQSLQAFSRRSNAKHTEEKMQGLWGRIKWTFWSGTGRIDYVGLMSQSRNNFSAYCKTASKTMQEKIILHMGWFEEVVGWKGDQEHPRTEGLTREQEQALYPTPRDIQKKWLPKFAPDKYPLPRGLSAKAQELAEHYRTRVFTMIKLWQHLNEFEAELAAADAPAAAPAVASTPLLT